MSSAHPFSFGPFRLDPGNARLWRGTHALPLTPKAFAVLHYLLEHAGELVTKDAFFSALWRDAVVSDGALKVCIAEIRRMLGDEARTPHFIQTEHRRGYRFIAPVAQSPEVGASPPSPLPSAPPLAPAAWPPPLAARRASNGADAAAGVV